MNVQQFIWCQTKGWGQKIAKNFKENSDLVFIFGGKEVLDKKEIFDFLKLNFPKAILVGCSTAGEIYGTRVFDDTLVVTAVILECSSVKLEKIKINEIKESYQAGQKLADSLDKNELAHVIIFSEGITVNGSELVNGLLSRLPEGIGVTGGLAADGGKFQETLICANEIPQKGQIAALGFYGSKIKFGYGAKGGFVPFGPERLVTKADGNILHELDGQSALDIYKKYLGEEKTEDLATNQFYFPLTYRNAGMKTGVVRTILSINEKNKTMTFAGDISEGGYAQMMKASHDKLIDGSSLAATITLESMKERQGETLALLISCVGRKIILKQRVEEEIEEVHEILGDDVKLMGFYSYGEIAHFTPHERCDLHNQTISITAFFEAE